MATYLLPRRSSAAPSATRRAIDASRARLCAGEGKGATAPRQLSAEERGRYEAQLRAQKRTEFDGAAVRAERARIDRLMQPIEQQQRAVRAGRPESLQSRILVVLTYGAAWSGLAVVEALGEQRRAASVQTALTKLASKGVIRRVRRGVYAALAPSEKHE